MFITNSRNIGPYRDYKVYIWDKFSCKSINTARRVNWRIDVRCWSPKKTLPFLENSFSFSPSTCSYPLSYEWKNFFCWTRILSLLYLKGSGGKYHSRFIGFDKSKRRNHCSSRIIWRILQRGRNKWKPSNNTESVDFKGRFL